MADERTPPVWDPPAYEGEPPYNSSPVLWVKEARQAHVDLAAARAEVDRLRDRQRLALALVNADRAWDEKEPVAALSALNRAWGEHMADAALGVVWHTCEECGSPTTKIDKLGVCPICNQDGPQRDDIDRPYMGDEPLGTCMVHGDYWTDDCLRCRNER